MNLRFSPVNWSKLGYCKCKKSHNFEILSGYGTCKTYLIFSIQFKGLFRVDINHTYNTTVTSSNELLKSTKKLKSVCVCVSTQAWIFN